MWSEKKQKVFFSKMKTSGIETKWKEKLLEVKQSKKVYLILLHMLRNEKSGSETKNYRKQNKA